VDTVLLRRLEAIGRLAGEDDRAARDGALALLAERDRALGAIATVDPPAMSPAKLSRRLTALSAALEALAGERAPVTQRAA
jgi:hypothetical protein